MSGLFKTPEPPPPPKVTRMPVATDPKIQEAVKRRRLAASQRTGRQSTIMTDLQNKTGSSGKLGAA